MSDLLLDRIHDARGVLSVRVVETVPDQLHQRLLNAAQALSKALRRPEDDGTTDEICIRISKFLGRYLGRLLTPTSSWTDEIHLLWPEGFDPLRRLDSECRSHYLELQFACAQLDQSPRPHPLLGPFQRAVSQAHADGRNFRIWTNSRDAISAARAHAPNISDLLSDDRWLRTVPQYRAVEPFDTLLFFGQMGRKGMLEFPRCLLHAAKYEELIYLHLAVGREAFPPEIFVEPLHGSKATPRASEEFQFAGRRVSVQRRFEAASEEPSAILPAVGGIDLEAIEAIGMSTPDEPTDPGLAIPVLLDGKVEWFAEKSPVLAIDDTGNYRRIVASELRTSDIIVRPRFPDQALGACKNVNRRRLARIWKEKLQYLIARQDHKTNFVETELMKRGVERIDLAAAIIRWKAPESSVVHGPDSQVDFERLIDFLWPHIESQSRSPHVTAKDWAHAAWAEITESRTSNALLSIEESRAALKAIEEHLDCLGQEQRARLATERGVRQGRNALTTKCGVKFFLSRVGQRPAGI
jgi:hypothetical protein